MLYHWSIIGHSKVLSRLEKDILKDNISHAYLFSGPAGVGKALIASTMAGILQCPNNYCKKCPTCLQVKLGHHFDTISLKDSGDSIKIEQIRELLKDLSLSVQARYKIIIMENIERMTPDAANCLLKTLEEPNPKTVFLLTTGNERQVLPTILSRVRLICFQAFSEKALFKELKNWFSEENENKLQEVASFSMGLPARAIRLLKDQDYFWEYERMYQTVQKFLKEKDLSQKFLFVEEIVKDDAKVEMFLDILLHLVRKSLLENVLGSRPEADRDYFLELIESVNKTKYLLKRSINARLSLESVMISI